MLLCFFFWCWHVESRLNVNAIWWTIHYKIHFQLSSDELTVLIFASKFYQTDINIIPTATKFVVDNVFHDVRLFLLAIVEYGSTDTNICKIILGFSTNVFSAFYIITQCLLYEERIFQIINILLYRVPFYGYSSC